MNFDRTSSSPITSSNNNNNNASKNSSNNDDDSRDRPHHNDDDDDSDENINECKLYSTVAPRALYIIYSNALKVTKTQKYIRHCSETKLRS